MAGPNQMVTSGVTASAGGRLGWRLATGAVAGCRHPGPEAVVAEASGTSTGGGLGLYESAALAGAAAGAVLAGALLQTRSWTTACLVLGGRAEDPCGSEYCGVWGHRQADGEQRAGECTPNKHAAAPVSQYGAVERAG